MKIAETILNLLAKSTALLLTIKELEPNLSESMKKAIEATTKEIFDTMKQLNAEVDKLVENKEVCNLKS